MVKHHPDLIFCYKQAGVAIRRLCRKCDGKCVIPMCVPAPWLAYAMKVTTDLTRAGVWSMEVLESLTPTIVKSATSRRRIKMVAQRLSIWGSLRQTYSMSTKNEASRRGDGWVAPSSPIELLQLPGKTPTPAEREQSSECHQSSLPVPVPWLPATPSFPPCGAMMEVSSHTVP